LAEAAAVRSLPPVCKPEKTLSCSSPRPEARGLRLKPKLGMILPTMGRSRSGANQAESLADALFTRTQQRVLGLLFGQPHSSFYASQIIALTGTGSGAAQRELARLERSGLVTSWRVGAQQHYQANPQSPLFADLCSIVQKTVGLAEPLRQALKPLTRQIDAVFIYGSVAKSSNTAESDIDLMLISDHLTYADVFAVLEPLIPTLGRAIQPTVYSREELRKRIREENSFVTRVLTPPDPDRSPATARPAPSLRPGFAADCGAPRSRPRSRASLVPSGLSSFPLKPLALPCRSSRCARWDRYDAAASVRDVERGAAPCPSAGGAPALDSTHA
jgi:predicted nucleotidyltransferase